ncbi:hypothetical protein AB205_0156640, partial [Aquarana catesbeiana]
MGARCFGGLPQSTLPMLRACGLVQFGGGRSLVPPLFLRSARLHARIRVWYGFWGGPLRNFFKKLGAGFPLISISDPKALIWILGGPPCNFFFNFGSGVPPNIHTRTKG